MKLLQTMLVLIFFCLLTTNAAALAADEIVVSSNHDWIIAGTGTGTDETATITVVVNNSSVSVKDVSFACLDSEFTDDEGKVIGALSPAKDTSGPDYSATFYTKKSGTANILVTVRYTVNANPGVVQTPVSSTVQQNIDHAIPYAFSTLDFESEMTVNGITDIHVVMKDKYGNPIDNRREMNEHPSEWESYAEEVEFICSPKDSGFWDGEDYIAEKMTRVVDEDGSVTVDYRISPHAGENIVWINAVLAVPERWITVYGIGNAEPVSMTVGVSPNVGTPPFVPADGESKFYLSYYLEDRFGNPAGNRTVEFVTSVPGEEFTGRTNMQGQIMISYGPRDATGTILITATSVDNASVTISTQVQFVSTDPTDMLLTANPQVMPSHDVDNAFTAQLRAKVIDEKGNPVANETVQFQIADIVVPAASTANPYLVSASNMTDANGYAVVEFVPGAFIFDMGDPDYDPTASASCNAIAIWNATSRTISLEWKNYPYLNVETEIDPETVAVNETFDATIRLIGNGWALQPDPIDVVLVIDRSGSMLKDNPDRMVSVMDAAKIFNGEMSEARDQVGLVSFGRKGTANIFSYGYKYWAGSDSTSGDDGTYISTHYPSNGKYYNDYATLDLGLSFDHATVDSSIDTLVPMDGTPMRGGIYKAIKEIKDQGRADAVRALIVLSDGDYNWYGDPLARGTGYTGYSPTAYGDLTFAYYKFGGLTSAEQDMRVFATNNNIRIYSIAFAEDISSGGRTTLQLLAEGTGGEYYYAPTGDDLAAVYTDIAGKLQTEAGVDTTMDVDFGNIMINNVSVPGAEALDYVYVPGISTKIRRYNATSSVTNTIDQTADWGDLNLHFDVGTIHLGETWEATMRFQPLTDGNILVFSSSSAINFNGTAGVSSLTLPDSYVTAVPELNATGIEFSSLGIENLNAILNGEFVTVAWNLNYTGIYDATQRCEYYRLEDPVRVHFQTLVVSGPFDGPQTATLVMRGLPYDQYFIRVHATAPDTPDDWKTVQVNEPWGIGDVPFIKIE